MNVDIWVCSAISSASSYEIRFLFSSSTTSNPLRLTTTHEATLAINESRASSSEHRIVTDYTTYSGTSPLYPALNTITINVYHIKPLPNAQLSSTHIPTNIMVLNSILHPLPSTHAHNHKHHHTTSTSSTHSPTPPEPGHLPHASTTPASYDTHNHKHYASHHSPSPSSPHHTHTFNPATYISNHQKEYTIQHSFSRAKHDARASMDTIMPDLSPPWLSQTNTSTSNPLTQEPSNLSPEEQAQLEKQEAEAAEAARKRREEDQSAWEKIVSAREAATRRSTIEGVERPSMGEWSKMSEGSVRTEQSRD
jgi:hypothetical protein